MIEANPKPAGRPKDQEKRAAILSAAKSLFLEHGFDRLSMDTLADRAGVSKLTVYSHFESKQALFKAVVIAKCEEFFHIENFDHMAERGAETALSEIAENFLRLILNPDVVALMRLLHGAAAQDQQLHELFYEAGPMRTKAAFTRLLKRLVASGELEIENTERACGHFFALLKGGDPVFRCELGLQRQPSPHVMRQHAQDCVRTFLRAFQRRR